MKKIIIMFAIVMFIGMASAATDTVIVDDTFKINSLVNYAKPCFNNGTYCSTSAYCNYTIFNPDNSNLINNQQATNSYTNYNISFYVNQLGIYTVNMVCFDGLEKGSETFHFEVTGSGFNTNLAFYLIILGISAAIIVGGFLLKDGWIVILGTIGLYFVGIYMLINGIDTIRNLTYTRGISLIVLGVAAYISINSAIEMIQEE